MTFTKLNTDCLRECIPVLNAGDKVLLSGYVYTSRDAAHKRIQKALDCGHVLPYAIKDAVIYYAGPTPTPKDKVIGSCGPTTSGRMDSFTPGLLDAGLVAMIGKGERSQTVKDAIVRNGCIYFCAVGGAGALAARCVKSCEVIAYEDLGCESVKKLYIKDIPLTVAVDCRGGDIFADGRSRWRSL